MSHITRIKICGFTRVDEAVVAAEAGIDAIGLVFAPSPRKVTRQKAADIVKELPPFVQTVGVFVNEPLDSVKEIVEQCSIDLVQLHGDESVEDCSQLQGRVIKASRVRSIKDIDALIPYQTSVRGFLLDAWVQGVAGGSGKSFDWSIAVEAVSKLKRPVILAGGLSPSNIAKAVRQVAPWGVDASSGVETEPGRKDIIKIREFVKNLRAGLS